MRVEQADLLGVDRARSGRDLDDVSGVGDLGEDHGVGLWVVAEGDDRFRLGVEERAGIDPGQDVGAGGDRHGGEAEGEGLVADRDRSARLGHVAAEAEEVRRDADGPVDRDDPVVAHVGDLLASDVGAGHAGRIMALAGVTVQSAGIQEELEPLVRDLADAQGFALEDDAAVLAFQCVPVPDRLPVQDEARLAITRHRQRSADRGDRGGIAARPGTTARAAGGCDPCADTAGLGTMRAASPIVTTATVTKAAPRTAADLNQSGMFGVIVRGERPSPQGTPGDGARFPGTRLGCRQRGTR